MNRPPVHLKCAAAAPVPPPTAAFVQLQAAAPAPLPAAASVPPPAAAFVQPQAAAPTGGGNVQNSDWDYISQSPAPSSLQLALVAQGTEMVEFDEESPEKKHSNKRRAFKLNGTDIWSVDHLSNETLTALDEVNSDIVVAQHPITKESLTHNAVMALVESKSYCNKMSLAEGIERLKQLGATNHQSAMDILFPTASV